MRLRLLPRRLGDSEISPINMRIFAGGRNKFYRFVHSLRSSFPSDSVANEDDVDGDWPSLLYH